MMPTCRRGHPRTPENTYTNPAGRLICRVCSAVLQLTPRGLRPARIAFEEGCWVLRAGKRGTGRELARADWEEVGALDRLRGEAYRAGHYVYHVEPVRTHNPYARLLLGGV